MNRSANTVTLLLLAVVASALLGLSVILTPSVALPFSIELILLFALTLWGLSREPDPDLRKWLTRLVLATLALRLLMVLVVQFNFSPYFFAPDAETYERIGKEISDYWAGVGFAPQAIREGWRPGYYHLNAVFHTAFGESRLALVVLNMFAGVWTALVTFYMTREILPVASAKAAAVLTGVFPSMVLWSILNIRDALATLCTVLIVLYGMRLSKRFQLSHLWIFAAAVLGLSLIRDYMAFLVVLGLAIGSVTALRTERVVGTLLFGTLVAVALTYFADQVGLFSGIRPEGLLETAQGLRSGLQRGATSAFGVGAETRTIGAALQYIPIGGSGTLRSHRRSWRNGGGCLSAGTETPGPRPWRTGADPDPGEAGRHAWRLSSDDDLRGLAGGALDGLRGPRSRRERRAGRAEEARTEDEAERRGVGGGDPRWR